MMQFESRAAATAARGRWRRIGVWLAWAGVGAYVVAIGPVSAAAVSTAFACLGLSIVGLWIRGRPRASISDLPDPVVTVDNGRLVVSCNGVPAIDVGKESVLGGWVDDEPRVVLAVGGGREIYVWVASVAQGEQLLAALGVSASDRVMRMPLLSSLGASTSEMIGALLIGIVGPFWLAVLAAVSNFLWTFPRAGAKPHFALVLTITAAVAAVLGAIVLGSVRLLSRRHAVVGSDGIVIEGGLRRLVVPLGDIADVSRAYGRVVLTRRSGQRVDLTPLSPGTTNALLRRVKQLLGQHVGARDAEAMLERRGRSIDAWTRELAGLVEDSADYRHRAIGREALEEIASDGSGGAERRIAAVFALGRMQPAASDAIERAIAATADADLARVLRHAAAGKIEARALARIERRYRVAEGEDEAPADDEREARGAARGIDRGAHGA